MAWLEIPTQQRNAEGMLAGVKRTTGTYAWRKPEGDAVWGHFISFRGYLFLLLVFALLGLFVVAFAYRSGWAAVAPGRRSCRSRRGFP
jgi:hypothetical protein